MRYRVHQRLRSCFASLTIGGLLVATAAGSRLLAEEFTPRNTQAAAEAPLPPKEALERLQVPAGFQITLAAAEPDVRQPIAIAFDDRGRLWVAESYSYNGSKFTDEPHDRILIFEDTTGDGVLDRRRVFCEGLTHLTGLEIGFGGVWITAPPYLAFLPDRDGNDVPDSDAVVHLDGWSLTAEHNSVNGLDWGPDGWLYGRHGIKQPSRVGRPGDVPEKRIELSCCIWRYHPTRQVFEVVAEGTINPWGLDFDDHGQGFLTTSVVEHLWHLVPGAHYQRWKNRGVYPGPHIYEAMSATSDHLHWASADKAGRMAEGNHQFGGGHSHCDAMIYLGDRWPNQYRGSLLTSNIHGRRINRDRLLREAGPYRGEHAQDFLVARDPWFRAVSMEYGPDGDVYLTDWSDNGECHDRDGVHRTSGRIYKVTWGDPIRVKVDLGRASNLQLVEYQLHRNDWFVRHGRRILQQRAAQGQDMSEAHLRLRHILATNPHVTRKLRALWALHVTGGLDKPRLLELLEHDNPHLRAWAVRLLAENGEPATALSSHFVNLAAGDKSWLVQMSLASALRRFPVGSRWPVADQLAQATAGSADPNLQRMIWYALEPEVVADPERAMQLTGAVAPRLRQWMARRITHESGHFVGSLFDELESQQGSVISDLLRGFNAASPGLKLDTVPDSCGRIVSKLIEHDDRQVRVAALTAAAALGGQPTLQRIRHLLHDNDSDSQTRLAALQGLAQRRPAGLSNDLQRLIAAGQLTSAALRAGATIVDPTLAKIVLKRYASFSKADQIAAVDLLVSRPESAQFLIRAIEQKQVPAADVSASQSRQIAALGDAGLLSRLQDAWGTVRLSPADRLQRIRVLERALDPSRTGQADLASGREIFKKTCASCHELFGDGRTIGPELTGSNRRNLHYLLSNVVDPSAVVPADFRLATVVTHQGRVITGAIGQRSDAVLAIQTATGHLQLKSEDIASVKISPQSMMPDGLLDKLDESQIRDLFAWMMSDGVEPDSSTDDLPLVILLGDSIRINYQKTVAAELEDKATVWSPDENCKHTAFTLEKLEQWIKGRNPAVVHINVGLHDMFLNTKTNQPRHSLDTYTRNLQQIFEKLARLTDATIIFGLTTPVDEARQAASKTYGRVVRRNSDVQRYNRAAKQIARTQDVAINDIHAGAIKAGVQAVLRESDGIHLSPFGAQVIGKQVAAAVLEVLDDPARVRPKREGKPPLPGKPPTDKTAARMADETGFGSIFNGRDLTGWDGKPGAWEVRDGEIWCTGVSQEKNWLIWREKQPADFVLRLEFRWDRGNSGVQVRSDDLGNWMVQGYQVEVARQGVMGLWHHSLLPQDHPQRSARHRMATAGQRAVLAEDGSKTVKELQDANTVKSHFRERGWNRLEIIANGDTLVQKINGVVFSTIVDRDKAMRRAKGVIALQDHGKDCRVGFRNIRLKVTPRP